jgi:rubredoxin
MCGFIYDEERGDFQVGIPPGTAWSALPAEWTCPVCGAARSSFYSREDRFRSNRLKPGKKSGIHEVL